MSRVTSPPVSAVHLVPLVPLVLAAALVPVAAVGVRDLPSESFQLHSAGWLLGGRGVITESDAVYSSRPADSLCKCKHRAELFVFPSTDPSFCPLRASSPNAICNLGLVDIVH